VALSIFDVVGMTISLCFNVLVTPSLYKSASKVHVTMSNPFEFMRIPLLDFIIFFLVLDQIAL
jgi:hypothetical protein